MLKNIQSFEIFLKLIDRGECRDMEGFGIRLQNLKSKHFFKVATADPSG